MSNVLVCCEPGPLVPLVPSADKFLKEQVSGARCLFVYTGAFSLGRTGLLGGEKTTANKSTYKLAWEKPREVQKP